MRWFIRPKVIGARQVLAFQALHPDSSSAAVASVARLRQLVEVLAALLVEQERQQEAAREAMAERNRVERLLRGLVAQLALLFRVLARHEGVVPPPVVARTRGAPAFVRGVAAVIAAAVEHRERLLGYGMTAGLLPELQERLAEYEGIEARREGSLQAALLTSPAMEQAGAEASKVVFHLDALNRIRFSADPVRLAEWRTVRAATYLTGAGAAAGSARRPAESADLDAHPASRQ